MIIIFVAFLFSNCREQNQSDIIKIEYAKGTCLGPCVPEAISIDNKLNYKFYSDSAYSWNKPKPKLILVNCTGVIQKNIWDELVAELNNANFKKTDTTKKIEIADAQHRELIIYYGKNKLRIYEPDRRFNKIETLLDSSYKDLKLHPVNYKLKFGTTLQMPLDFSKNYHPKTHNN